MDVEMANFRKEIKEKYISQRLADANQMRKSGSLCDVILRVNNKDFPAHRSVLASASLYFRGLFMSQMKEEDQMIVDYDDLDSRWIEEILSFIYTGNISFTEENAVDIIAVADYLIIPSLKELGTLFLQKQITHWNCFSLHVFGKKFSCKDLSAKTKKYINQNFETLCFSEGFKAVDVDILMEFLKSDEIQISREEVIFEAIQEWIYHDLDDRKQYFEKLFGCVRLLCISKYYLADYVESESLVKQSSHCTSMLFKAFKSLAFSDHENIGADRNHVELGTPRKCLKKEEVSIVVTGGTYLTIQANHNTDSFLPAQDKWMRLAEMNYPRDEHVTVVCEDFLYAIGGYKKTHAVERYDPRINTWTEVASLQVNCASAAAVTVDGRIYVIGGRDSFQPYNTVQCYNPEDNTWCLKAPMNVRRKAHSAVVLDGYIYAIGGVNDTYGQLAGVESYDPGLDHWRHETTMCTRRNFACATVINRKIYVIGGYEAEDMSPLSSCEVFDPDTGTWTVLPDMHVRRAAAGIATINGRIYIIGGVSEHGARADVECYDSEKKKWEVVFSMSTARAYIQCNVVKLPKRLVSKQTNCSDPENTVDFGRNYNT